MSLSRGISWLGSASSPSVANTAVSASSNGRPAAIKAPKATTSTINVTGSENTPAFLKSLTTALSSCVSTLTPNSSIAMPGCLEPAATIAFSTGLSSVIAFFASVVRSSRATSAVWRSLETRSSLPTAKGDSIFFTWFRPPTVRTTSVIAAWKAGSSTVLVVL